MLRKDRGTVLVLAVVAILLLVGLSGGLLTQSVIEGRQSAEQIEAMRTFYLAEAGMNRSMAELIANADLDGNGTIGSVTGSAGGGTYQTTVTVQGNARTVQSSGYFASSCRLLEGTFDLQSSPLFTKALFGDLSLGTNGTVFADSYNSTMGSYASQAVNFHAPTGKTYARTEGDLGSNMGISLGGTSATVFGDVTPGPGHMVSMSGSPFVYGSTAPASSSSPLSPLTYNPPIGSGGLFQAQANDTVSLGPGTFRYDRFLVSGSANVTLNGNVTLYVDESFSITGNAQVTLAADANVTIYADGPFSVDGTGIVTVNQGGGALEFLVYATGTNTGPGSEVKLSGTSDFYGAVYAPGRVVDVSGTSRVFGALVGKSITASGTADFHYDEALATLGATAAPVYKLKAWRELASCP